MVLALLAAIVLGCGEKKSGKPYIALVSKGFQNQFWQAVKRGAEKAAQDYNVAITFDGPELESMVGKQSELFQNALAARPAAICVAALDPQAIRPLLEKARSAGIPVIGFDSGADSDVLLTTAATNNAAAAALAADRMAALIGEAGQVAVIVHDQVSRNGIERRDGFLKRMAEAHPKVTVVAVQYGGDQGQSADQAKRILRAHPKLKGFFGANEGSSIGILDAVAELKREGRIVVVGFDSGRRQQEAIRSGVEAGAITQDPIGIGYKSVEAAVKAIRGETLPRTIDSGFYWYDKSNMDTPEIEPLLYN